LAEFDDNFRVAPGISNITANHFEEGLAHDDDFTHLDHEISRKFTENHSHDMVMIDGP